MEEMMQEEKASVSQSLWSPQIRPAHANFKSGKTVRKHDGKSFRFGKQEKKPPQPLLVLGTESVEQSGWLLCLLFCPPDPSWRLGNMAANETHPILQILDSFGIESVILAFCLSMLVGLLIGVFIFVLLTWLSRHRASAVITKPTKRKKSSRAHNRMGLYRSHGFQHLVDNSNASTHLNARRQASLDTDEVLGRKMPFKASTFHPPGKGGSLVANSPPSSPCTQDIESPSTNEESLLPNSGNKRQSFWLGGNGLRGYLPTQTPPPAYDSVINAFQETET